MYGAHSSIGRLWYNQSAAVLGNIVGGAIFIGLMEHLLNHWRSPIFRSSHDHDGTLVGHDIESTRRARDTHPQPRHRNQQAPEIRVDDATVSQRMSQENTDTENHEAKQRQEPADRQDEHPAETTGAAPAKPAPSFWRTLRTPSQEKDATNNV